MKIKTADLTGHALDWAVAKCEWVEWTFETATTAELIADCHYSTNWSQGGPIIEREQIGIHLMGIREDVGVKHWLAKAWVGNKFGSGATMLTAAMRCFVASKLGDEVDVPEELA